MFSSPPSGWSSSVEPRVSDGHLEPGKLADILVGRGDPLADLRALGTVESAHEGIEANSGRRCWPRCAPARRALFLSPWRPPSLYRPSNSGAAASTSVTLRGRRAVAQYCADEECCSCEEHEAREEAGASHGHHVTTRPLVTVVVSALVPRWPEGQLAFRRGEISDGARTVEPAVIIIEAGRR